MIFLLSDTLILLLSLFDSLIFGFIIVSLYESHFNIL
jgi:hypothetical protein